jgi:hypothetical protein
MDLASGYSDSINYGNGYTPLANNAINNNNADYMRNQAAIALMAQQAQNNVFASGGGFGNQTAYYAGLGADYGRATGGFGGYSGGGGYPSGDVQRGPDLPNLSTTPDPFGASRSWDGSVNTPEASALMLQNPAAYYAKYGGGAGMMASGGDTSWIGAGGSNNDYNPFGQINSGQVGQYDPFMGYQPQPTFDQRYGSWGGQPYGPGYFDNTFGSVSQNGPGSFNSRFPWPNTPGMTSSDQSEAARQQAIQDLMRLLGTTVAPAYDPHVAPDVPSTLVPGDYRLRDTWTNAS